MAKIDPTSRTGNRASHPIRRKTIKIEPGDAVIFRGDLTHAGCAYDSTNYRIHIYDDSPVVQRRHNRTHLMTGVAYIQ